MISNYTGSVAPTTINGMIVGANNWANSAPAGTVLGLDTVGINSGANVGSVTGMYAYATHDGAGYTSAAIGLDGLSSTDVRNTGGDISLAIGVKGDVGISSTGTNNITTAYGLATYILDQGPGTISNGYGLHIGVIQATTKYSIYATDATAPAYFAGNVQAAAFVQNSDARLKENIEPMSEATWKLLQLRPVSFTWKEGAKQGEKDIGFIAQEVENIVPEAVQTSQDGYKTMDYS